MSHSFQPKAFAKLPLQTKVNSLEVDATNCVLAVSTQDKKMQSFFVQQGRAGVKNKVVPLLDIYTQCSPDIFAVNSNNLYYCNQQILHINSKSEICHSDRINHMIVDDQGIALTTSQDTIYINNLSKSQQQGKMQSYGATVSALYWKNSLTIGGDQLGQINLWDINKQKQICNKTLFTSPVSHVNSYLDYVHNNFYYSVCQQQRKIMFHDLRSNSIIKIVNNLPKNVEKYSLSSNGKIYFLTKKTVQIIDLYHGFEVIGRFAQMSGQKMDEHTQAFPKYEAILRQLTCCELWDKYLIVGCNNGNIEVYDSDTLSCLYGFGMCQAGQVKQLRRIGNSLLALSDRGLLTIAQMQ